MTLATISRFAIVLAASAALAADTHWIQTKSPSFEVVSDAAPKAMRSTLGDLEQFRFALGQVLGKELTFAPPMPVLLFRDAQEMEAHGASAGLVDGRARTVLVGIAGQPLPPATTKQLAKLLIERSVGKLPDDYERGLETFFSTLNVAGAKVTWGALPPAQDRTRDWARIHMLATTPEYAGRMRVLFFNLQRGIPADAAWPNAYGKPAAEMEREVDAYFHAGKFGTADGPSTALSPDRDFYIKDFPAAQQPLIFADLLTSQSAGMYQQMLQNKQNVAEAEEGLGLLAQRAGDPNAAREHWKRAIAAGSKNDAVLVAYARLEKQSAPARAALDQAVQINPNSAEAHYLLGEKASDPEQRTREYAAATRLAPQNLAYWEALARWQLEQKQFAAAASAWTSAEQAARNSADRERMHAARMAIEAQRLDYEEAEQQRVAASRQAAIDKLKAQALAELHAAEAKANHGRTAGGAAAVEPMPWPDDQPGNTKVEGTLLRVECEGKTARLVMQTSDDKTLRLVIPDLRESALACGPAKKQRIAVEYSAKPVKRAAADGVLTTVTFH